MYKRIDGRFVKVDDKTETPNKSDYPPHSPPEPEKPKRGRPATQGESDV